MVGKDFAELRFDLGPPVVLAAVKSDGITVLLEEGGIITCTAPVPTIQQLLIEVADRSLII